jgi:hypothetical protein
VFRTTVHKLRWPLVAAGAAALSLLVSSAGATVAGDPFKLGVTNTINLTTSLSGNTQPAQLKVTNANAGGYALWAQNTGGGPALLAAVNPSVAPLAVNSNVKVANLNADLLDGFDSTAFWKLAGNAGTTPGTHFLGTSDNQALELKVNGARALRLEPKVTSPNVIGGFSGNAVTGGAYGATIGGGGRAGAAQTVSAPYATIAGGFFNTASGPSSTVTGGVHNTASGATSTVAGGISNTASGIGSTVAGGYGNTASGEGSAVAGGYSNTASGLYSAVAGGNLNTASGTASFAAGTQAKATQNGSFVWGDNTSTDLTSPAVNTFTVRASGGIWLGTTSSASIPAGRFINTSTGGYLSTGGAWTNFSDRAHKRDFRPINRQSVLQKVARMPLSSWSYKAEQPAVRHIGPTAQDFYAAFGLGLDDKHIGTIDEGGVALAAIQGLYRQNQALQARVAKLEQQVAKLSH